MMRAIDAGRRRTAVWIAAVVVGIAAMVESGSGASAQNGPAVGERTYHFNIAAKARLAALADFTAATGIQIVRPDANAISGTSSSVTGNLTARQALAQLLNGSGLTAANTATLEKLTLGQSTPGATLLPPVQVEGQVGGESAYGPVQGYVARQSATGTKTDTPILETPQSITVVPRDQIEAQNVQSVAQALRYSPGVVAEQRGINTDSLEYIYSRGFQIDTYMNGLRLPNAGTGFNILSVDSHLLERVELLRGPASILYGQASPGGLINLVTKQPTLVPFGEVEFQTGSFGRLQGAFDIGGPIGDAERGIAYRVIGDGLGTGTQVSGVDQERYLIAPSFFWQMGPDTKFTFYSAYQYDPQAGFYNLVPAAGTVLPNVVKIPRNLNPGDPTFDRYQKIAYFVGYNLDHRLDDVFSFVQNLRFLHSTNHIQGVFADDGLTQGGLALGRYSYLNHGKVSDFAIDNQLHARFTTGALGHRVTTGIDYQKIDYRHTFQGNFATPDLNILNPVYGNIPFPNFLFGSSGDDTSRQIGIYAQDQIRWDHWAFLFGVRRDWADSDSLSLKSFTKSGQVDRAFSGRAGLTYLFDNGLAPYASFSTSFEPNVGTDFFGTPFKPTTGQQYEVGIKFQPEGMKSFVSVAGFNLTQQNVETADPAHAFFTIQTGEIRSRGFEIEGRAQLFDNIGLIGAYTFADVINTKSAAATVDKRPTGIPRHMASLWGDYSFPAGPLRGLQIGAGVRYVGPTAGDAMNSFTVPSYTLVDAAVHYDLGTLNPSFRGWQATVTANNIFDKTYVSQCIGLNDCSYGLARVVLAKLKYRW